MIIPWRSLSKLTNFWGFALLGGVAGCENAIALVGGVAGCENAIALLGGVAGV
ncbi:hypothetical protein [Arthrospira sp. PCC 8006]|uniref:hypothetical protein n=1 Tax=Arthrospira sp. PCC 8006 TaxID=1982224 RepID=UPI00396F4CCD